jgi:hypothetical protein
MIANAPWYVPNITLLEGLNVPLVKEVIKQISTRYHNKIGHVNVLIQPLLQPHNERSVGASHGKLPHHPLAENDAIQ